jgi:hypothetical protein
MLFLGVPTAAEKRRRDVGNHSIPNTATAERVEDTPEEQSPGVIAMTTTRHATSHPRASVLHLLLLLIAAISSAFIWSVSSPTGASPDEPSHIYYAWGTISGQVFSWNLEQTGGENTTTRVAIDVPDQLNQFASPSCYIGKVYSDECNPSPQSSNTVEVTSYMARYPLTYYAVVGAALKSGLALGLSGFSTLILARIVSGVLCYGALAVAGIVLARRFGIIAASLPILTLLVPNAHFLMNSINPNGFEIAACAAVAALIVAFRHDVHVSGTVNLKLQTALLVFTLVAGWTRPMSIVWVGLLLLLLLAPIRDRKCPLRYFNKALLAMLFIVVLFILTWFVWEATGTQTETVAGDINDWRSLPIWLQVGVVIFRFGELLKNGYGLLGWADTELPIFSLILWIMAATGVLTAFATGSRQHSTRPQHALIYVVSTAIAVTAESVYAGFGWQGRYWIPALAAGLILLTPSLSGARLAPLRQAHLAATLGFITIGLTVHGLLFNLWRYQFGVNVPFVRFTALPIPTPNPDWSPAGGSELFYFVLCVFVLSSCIIVLLISKTSTTNVPKLQVSQSVAEQQF